MNSEIRIYQRENNEIQRVQVIYGDSWEAVDFLTPTASPEAFDAFCNIYRSYLVPAFPWIFRQMVLFRLPPEESGDDSRRYAYAKILREGLRIKGGKPRFQTAEAQQLYRRLAETDSLQLICGKRPGTQIIPVADHAGYLSENGKEAEVCVNGPFFIMDCFDVASEYDQVSVPFGLAVKDGLVKRPPLYDREALVVHRDGSVKIERPSLKNMSLEIGGHTYTIGRDAVCFCRPEFEKTPAVKNAGREKQEAQKGTPLDLVIIGRQLVDVRPAGGVSVPASGFVLRIDGENIACGQKLRGQTVTYLGFEDVTFAIQVGNSTVIDGQTVKDFRADYYDIKKLGSTEFPPSLYPLNYEKARAARIALGADAAGKPMLVWAEGAAKYGHQRGRDSCGASLAELADICVDLGMQNGINLDGGGSAQIRYRGKRSLDISDRSPADYSCCERPVPEGIVFYKNE